GGLLGAWAGIQYDPEVAGWRRASLASIVAAATPAAAAPIAGAEPAAPRAEAQMLQPGVAALWSTPDPADSRDVHGLPHRGISAGEGQARLDGTQGLSGAPEAVVARTVRSDV